MPPEQPAPTFTRRSEPDEPATPRDQATSTPPWDLAESDRRDEPPSAAHRTHHARAAVLGAAGVLAIGVVAVLTLGGGGDDRDLAAEATATSDVETTKASTTTTKPATSRSNVPRTTTAPSVAVRIVDAGGADDGFGAAVIRPALETLALGRTVPWTTWWIPVDAPLDTISAPTEVVLLTASGLHRLDLPSGEVRSVAIEGNWDGAGQLAVAGDTIAVTGMDDVLLLRDGLPAIEVEVGWVDGIRARPSNGDFVLSVRDDAGLEPPHTILLAPDGTVTPIDAPWFDRQGMWGAVMSPTGELIANAPGGVYARQPVGGGAARRIHPGSSVGGGANHALVQTCDETLVCGYERMDLVTGEVVPVAPVLDDLGPYGFDMPRLSPDGARVAVMAFPATGPPSWLVHDLATGQLVIEIQLESWTGYPTDPWSADSSGLLLLDGDVLTFRSLDRSRVDIDGFGALHQAAVHSAPAATAG